MQVVDGFFHRVKIRRVLEELLADFVYTDEGDSCSVYSLVPSSDSALPVLFQVLPPP